MATTSSKSSLSIGFAFVLVELFSFIVIGYYSNWLLSILLFAILVLTSIYLTRAYPTDNFYVGFFLIFVLLTPLLSASFLVAAIKGIGYSLLVIHIALVVIFFRRSWLYIKKLQHQQNNWIEVSLQLPNHAEIVFDEIKPFLANDLKSTIHLRQCMFTFPIEYEINNELIQIDNFQYQWFAPQDNPTQQLDYDKQLKGTSFQIKCNPNCISEYCASLPKEHIDLMIRQSIKYRNRYCLFCLPIALLAILLIIIG